MVPSCIPLPDVAKLLETGSAADLQTVLQTLASPSYINEGLIKSDMGILNAKLLKLLRSSDDVDVWKGCHATSVVCHYNPLFLLTYVDQLFGAIYTKLSQKVDYYTTTVSTSSGRTVLETLTSTLGSLMNLMRGKPTISRESLVPKLRAIIPTLINLCQYEPKICLPILEQLLYRHPTTFRPFMNRYSTLLKNLLSERFDLFDDNTRDLLCRNFAYLHLKRPQAQQVQDENQASNKPNPDDTWRDGLFSVLVEFKPVIDICNHFLDFEQDKDFVKLVESLPNGSQIKTKQDPFLPPLSIDMNQPLTLWAICNRLHLLCKLVEAFVTSPTPFPIRVPIGSLHTICEALLGVCRKYIPLRKEVQRDAELIVAIDSLLPKIQICGVRLWLKLIKAYGKSLLMYTGSMLGSIELFIPLKPKSHDIDMEQCKSLGNEFLDVFKLTNLMLKDMGCQAEDGDLINKLLEIALELSEDRSMLQNLGKKSDVSVRTKEQKANKGAKTPMGTLTDLYTHPEQFQSKTTLEWFAEVNKFIKFVLENRKLGTGLQIQIIRYAINKSLALRDRNGQHIPQSFIELLRAIVLNPGHEKTSILPIAVSLLKDSGDEMLDLFCHPRLAVSSIIYSTNKNNIELENEEMEEEQAKSLVLTEKVSTDIEEKVRDVLEEQDVSGSGTGVNSTRIKRPAEEEVVKEEEEVKDTEEGREENITEIGNQPFKRARVEDISQEGEPKNQTEPEVIKGTLLITEEKVEVTTGGQERMESSITGQKTMSNADDSALPVKEDTKGADGDDKSENNIAEEDNEEDEDSEFEIPEIQVSEDEEEEEEDEEEQRLRKTEKKITGKTGEI